MSASALRSERLQRIAAGRGVNHFPSWAASPVLHWAGALPVETLRRELMLAADLGFDHVRVWLSAHGYESDPAEYIRNLWTLFGCAEQVGLGVVVELFDSCGIEPDPVHAREVRVEEIRALVGAHPSRAGLERLSGGGRDVFGGPALVRVPFGGDPLAAIWEGWVPNPGHHLLGDEHWARWERYALAILECVRDSEALWLVEVMNEPTVTAHAADERGLQLIRDFCARVYALLRRVAPGVPLSIGSPSVAEFARTEAALGEPLDCVSIHSFWPPEHVAAELVAAHALSDGRPVYLSEWGFFPGGDDGAQRDALTRLLPLVEEAKVGWAISHLIAGYGPFGLTALLYPSGIMRPAAQWLREQLQASGGVGSAPRAVALVE